MEKAIIKLGYTCNNNCLFCHSKDKRKHKDLSTDQVKNRLVMLKNRYPKIKMVIFSGGEPAIRKDFFDIIKFANKLGYSIGLNTNGRMLQSKKFTYKLFNLGLRFIQLSLHGAQAKTHDSITQVPGSFDQTIRAIKNLLNYKIEKRLNFVVNTKNISEIKDTIELLKPFDIKIKFSFIEPSDHKELAPHLMLAAKKVKETILYSNSIGVSAGLDGFPLCIMDGFEGYLDNLKSNNINLISESYEEDFFSSDEGNKIKIEPCKDCFKNKKCEGIYKEYISFFGDSEIIQSKKKMDKKNEMINYYKFLTAQLVSDDLYPPLSAAEEISKGTIKKSWEETVEKIKRKEIPEKLGLYIHIPFCAKKCLFCFCLSFVPKSYPKIKDYLKLVYGELAEFKGVFKDSKFTSVYIGGGTPSLLKKEDIYQLFNKIYSNIKLSEDAMVIFEGTPASLTDEKILALKKCGVSRLTVGAQSLDPEVLKQNERFQNFGHIKRAVNSAQKVKIPCVNIDLITGLPGQTVESFLDGLKKIVALRPTTIHLNSFSPLPYTNFCKQGKYLSKEDKLRREKMFDLGEKMLKEAGYSGKGHEDHSLNENSINLQEIDLRRQNSSLFAIGFGAMGHTFNDFWYEHPYPDVNFTVTDSNLTEENYVYKGYKMTKDEEIRKYLITNLNTGFNRKDFKNLFGADVMEVFSKEIKKLEDWGCVLMTNEKMLSFVKTRKEKEIFSKIFFSKKVLKILNKKEKFDINKNYELDNYFEN